MRRLFLSAPNSDCFSECIRTAENTACHVRLRPLKVLPLDGLQCPKLLWVRAREPERIFTPRDPVGAVAQSLHPGGVLGGGAERGRLTSADLRAALDETRSLLAGSDGDPTSSDPSTSAKSTRMTCGSCARLAGGSTMPRSP
jgi:hypothetical protein